MNKKNSQKYKHASYTGLIGVEQKDITPSVEIYSRNWGASEYDTAEGVHQSLILTCLTFQSPKKEKPLVLISADLGWWKSLNDEWYLRSSLLKALSLPASNLLVCLSHTHSGPSIFRGDMSKKGGQHIAPYLDAIQKKAIEAAEQALATAAPATLTWHYGKCNLAANRDLAHKDNKRYTVGFNPNGTPDDTLLVGRITNKQQCIIATIVNYACHPTTLGWKNRLLSPDYIGAMRKTIRAKTQAPCLFLQGASGDLAPAEQYMDDPRVAEKHGRQLGYAVLATLEHMQPPLTQLVFNRIVESGAPLAIWGHEVYQPTSSIFAKLIEVPFPLKSLPPLDRMEQRYRKCDDHVIKERLRRKIAIRKAIGNGTTARMPFWIWQLGDSVLVGQPNEAYSRFQMELRNQLPFEAIGVINIANGSMGYLPPHHLYDQNIYSVWQTPFAKGSLELLTETVLKEVQKLMVQD